MTFESTPTRSQVSPVNRVTIHHWAARDAVTDLGYTPRSQGSVVGHPATASVSG